MEQRLQDLEHQLGLLKKCLFGSRSEKVSSEELEARIAEHARETAQAVGESKRPDAPVACARLLALIQQLYRIERRAKEEKLDRAGLLAVRVTESRPVMENLGKLLRQFADMRPPKTPFGKAMSYAEGQWPSMMRYLEVPAAELDNNSIEHALRSVVMGRRNWLHVGQEVGGNGRRTCSR